MSVNKRGNVWLGVSGLVINEAFEWLVVKKSYGGLKGMWSLPAGFVAPRETADAAAVREVFEETGINCAIQGLIGLRTGVISDEISDNMLVFSLKPKEDQIIKVQESEILEARFIDPDELLAEKSASVLLHHLANLKDAAVKAPINGINPGDHFNYTAYKLFL
ncbi:NUDIX domain-containing protein [Bacillus sp. V33-4]|uniref:NUDIX domain-containing protein n=1 Tax=Bacillus sp. V33-4 TaxID=2054169 RepID=UPI000C780CFC|nr:NUDIX hydrolase [Bacillus sp. V33-4]PLR85211.1 NUDIX hydrolase [Bacillus sp. V33-4]